MVLIVDQIELITCHIFVAVDVPLTLDDLPKSTHCCIVMVYRPGRMDSSEEEEEKTKRELSK